MEVGLLSGILGVVVIGLPALWHRIGKLEGITGQIDKRLNHLSDEISKLRDHLIEEIKRSKGNDDGKS